MSFPEQTRYVFTDKDFNFIRKLIAENAGININQGKRELVYARLSKRLRALELKTFRQYCKRIEEGDNLELVNCIDAITTNVTYFFRENHHFEFLSDVILPSFISDSPQSRKRRLRVWSAGCSTGEEAYSIEIILRQFKEIDNWDTKILATDLSTNVLNIAREGIYRRSQVENVTKENLKKWFRQNAQDKNLIKVTRDLKRRIYYKHLNLNQPWKIKGPIDIIFCRNVVIYFDKDTQKRLFDRFADILSENGFLIIGHSETMFGISDRFKLVSRTIYKKLK